MKQIQKEQKSIAMMVLELSSKVSEIATICQAGEDEFTIDLKTHYEAKRHEIHLAIYVEDKIYELLIARDMVDIDFISKRGHNAAWFKDSFDEVLKEIEAFIEELYLEKVMS